MDPDPVPKASLSCSAERGAGIVSQELSYPTNTFFFSSFLFLKSEDLVYLIQIEFPGKQAAQN